MQQVTIYDHFIGRKNELTVFSRWLVDPQAPWIMYIYDAAEEASKKGGVGKTWLLRKYAQLVQHEHKDVTVVMIDFFNIADRNPITVVERVVSGLQTLYPGWSASSFTSALAQYRAEGDRTGRVYDPANVDTGVQARLSSALIEDLQQLDNSLGRKKPSLLVFFDTFELVEQNPAVAVLRLSQTFPDNYSFLPMRIVIAGRNKLDWRHTNWSGREQEIFYLPLEPFTFQETLRYLEAESVFNIPGQASQARALYERTEGRPILIGLAIDVLNRRVLALDELVSIPKTNFESYLVTRVNKLENPLNWVIIFMAHIYHRFNLSILEWILQETAFREVAQEISYSELLATLPRLSFVRRSGSGDDFVLHDEMRRLVTKYCWAVQDPQDESRKEISRCVLSYYEQELAQAANEQQRQALNVEMLYHRFYVDVAEGWRFFDQQFQEARLLKKSAFARLLFQEGQKFVHLLSSAQYNNQRFMEANLLFLEQNIDAALLILQQLERTPDKDWLTGRQKDVLKEIGSCYLQQHKLPEAADYFTRCLAIEQEEGNERRSAHLLVHLGIIARRRGQFDAALSYYERSITIYKKLGLEVDYATTLANMSLAYRLQGKVEEALLRGKIAWRLRQGLFQRGKGSETQVGASLYNLGTIYLYAGSVTEAEQCFNDALAIYLRVNYRSGLASVYNRLGQLQLMRGEIDDAREWLEKAQLISQDVDPEQYINSLNKQGAVCALRQDWEGAVAFLEHAIIVAQQILDYYQQAESLIDLASVLEHLEQWERVWQALQQAQDISIRENFYYLLGRIEVMKGEIHHKAKEYSTAFQHFALYCYNMAQYNSYEFNIALRKVLDFLFDMPGDEAPAIIQTLIAYWIEQQLDKSHPRLINVLEEVYDSLVVQADDSHTE